MIITLGVLFFVAISATIAASGLGGFWSTMLIPVYFPFIISFFGVRKSVLGSGVLCAVLSEIWWGVPIGGFVILFLAVLGIVWLAGRFVNLKPVAQVPGVASALLASGTVTLSIFTLFSLVYFGIQKMLYGNTVDVRQLWLFNEPLLTICWVIGICFLYTILARFMIHKNV